MLNFTKSFFYPNLSLYDYPILTRYPNPYSSHVVASDTIKSYTKTDKNGKSILVIERILAKVSKLHVPLIKNKLAFVLERIEYGDKIEVQNLNISHTKWMRMLEHQTIQQKLQFNKKQGKEINGVSVNINTNIQSWNSIVEQFCLKNYKENVKRAQNGMKCVMERMGWKMQTE
eukprot:NODE_77_length_23338_cov_0.319463.p10 type:complete len:173 gc:universal NODE_77_length_23338_cov_0.319463:5536-6054(+)